MNRMIGRVANRPLDALLRVAEVQRKQVMPGCVARLVLLFRADSDLDIELLCRLEKTLRPVGSSWKEKQEPPHVIADGTCGTVPSGHWPQ